MDLVIFLVTLVISVRTFFYGVWTFRGENILGGIFVMALALFCAGFSAYVCFFSPY